MADSTQHLAICKHSSAAICPAEDVIHLEAKQCAVCSPGQGACTVELGKRAIPLRICTALVLLTQQIVTLAG